MTNKAKPGSIINLFSVDDSFKFKNKKTQQYDFKIKFTYFKL